MQTENRKDIVSNLHLTIFNSMFVIVRIEHIVKVLGLM